jgi:hypothetical protein
MRGTDSLWNNKETNYRNELCCRKTKQERSLWKFVPDTPLAPPHPVRDELPPGYTVLIGRAERKSGE